MNVFVEYLVKKKKGVSEYLQILAIACLGVLGVIIAFSYLMRTIPQFGSLITLAAFAGIYFLYVWITCYNVEYEYALIDNEIDVDKITNQRKRKRMTTVKLNRIEVFGTKGESADFEKHIQDANISKIYACADKTSKDVFFVVYSEDDKKKMLLFNPNEKMRERIEKIALLNRAV